LNRDPIDEDGGLNLYRFVGNSSINQYDLLGLQAGPVGPTDPRWPGLPGSGDERKPLPLMFPPPLLTGDDTLPVGYEGFSLCQRPLDEDGCSYETANFCGAGHKFLKYNKGGVQAGYGFYKQGVVEEKNLDCDRGVPCRRTNSPLKYGIGSVENKIGRTATDEEILDCIRNRPKIGEYILLRNDCRHWPPVAAQDCGLSCGRQSNYYIPPTGTVPFYSTK